jgi:YidC/Oxa1 family membrane protein insertase
MASPGPRAGSRHAMQGFFSPLSDFFFVILRFLNEGLNISWSWAIVVLTIVVRVVLIPLTWRQMKSMRAMQALQPHIKALQEKYKNDRQLLNQKMMEFYRENKVNPFGSCLPLLFQLPVFLGLFYMLGSQGSPNAYIDAGAFAPVWHSQPISWLWIPDITGFNLALMFVYIASQFASSWQMARKSAGQQRVIAFLMPVMVGVFMYIGKWPAGLMIYWFTSNLWSIAQQLVVERVMPVPVAAAAILEKDKARAARKSGSPKAAAGMGVKGVVPSGKNLPSGGTKSGKQPEKQSPQPDGQTPRGAAGQSGGKSSAKRKGQKR